MKIIQKVKALLPLYYYNRNIVITFLIALISIFSIIIMGIVKVRREEARRTHFFMLLQEYQNKPSPETLDSLVSKALSSSFLKRHFASALIQEELYAKNDKAIKQLRSTIPSFGKEDGYAKFSEISFAISSGDLNQALTLSLELEKNIDRNESFALFCINEIRLAFLYQKLGMALEEKAQYQKILSEPEMLGFLQKIFSDGSLTIKDYIDVRLKNLN